MPLLNDQAGAAFANLRAVLGKVHIMSATAQQGGGCIGRPCQGHPQKAFPPLQAGFRLAFSVGIFHALLPRRQGRPFFAHHLTCA